MEEDFWPGSSMRFSFLFIMNRLRAVLRRSYPEGPRFKSWPRYHINPRGDAFLRFPFFFLLFRWGAIPGSITLEVSKKWGGSPLTPLLRGKMGRKSLLPCRRDI